MSITNLEQIRAARAISDAKRILDKRAPGSGDQLVGYHSLIITNGLLATLAYSMDKKGEHLLIAETLVHHIAYLQSRKLLPGTKLPQELKSAIRQLADEKESAEVLAIVTEECMAYLNYLKRFVRASKEISQAES